MSLGQEAENLCLTPEEPSYHPRVRQGRDVNASHRADVSHRTSVGFSYITHKAQKAPKEHICSPGPKGYEKDHKRPYRLEKKHMLSIRAKWEL